MNKKKAAGVAGGAAVVITAIIIATTGGSQSVDVEYSIESKNEYVSVMSINTPDDESIEIAALYLNGTEVDKTVLPDGRFESIPLVFEDPSKLEIKLYRLGKCVGTAKLGDSAGTAKAVSDDA